ncbi:MAG: hypothetical protein ACLFNO_02820 [Parcubacteria group bacterium]
MDKIVYVFIGLLFAFALLVSALGIFLWGDAEVKTIKMIIVNTGLIVVIELTCMLVITGGLLLYNILFDYYED